MSVEKKEPPFSETAAVETGTFEKWHFLKGHKTRRGEVTVQTIFLKLVRPVVAIVVHKSVGYEPKCFSQSLV